MSNLKTKLLKILGLILWLAFIFILSIAIHEMAHYFVLKATGGNGNIQFPSLAQGLVEVGKYPDTAPYLFLFAGGLVTALVFGILWVYARLTPTKWDLPQEVGLAIAALWNLQYGTMEGLGYWWPWLFETYRDLAAISTALAIAALYHRPIGAWLRAKNEQ